MNSVIGVRREVRRMQACGSSLLFRIVEHAGPLRAKHDIPETAAGLAENIVTPCKF
jgi:hypothetical protein